MDPSKRISFIKPYFFVELSTHIKELEQNGINVIRLDIGAPDMPPPNFIIESLINSAKKSNTHSYTPYGGTKAYRAAIAHYYLNRFGVQLDPDKEIVGLIGSKEGIFKLSQALLNPGDIAIIPSPGYPTYGTSAQIAGADVYYMPLKWENDFLPEFKKIPKKVLNKTKILWLNYPNNPTGSVAHRSFFEDAVKLASSYNFLIAHDAAYVDLCFDEFTAPSLLQIPGALELSVEFNTLSKTYNMAGWRLGMACGNRKVLSFLHTYKVQSDTAHFEPVLAAGITALTGDQSWIDERNQIYKTRRDIILESLPSQLTPFIPKGSLYIWAKLPSLVNDIEFCKKLLQDAGVSIIPGSTYGPFGRGNIRISLCQPIPQTQEAMERLNSWFQNKFPGYYG